jgi:hypothetical protein
MKNKRFLLGLLAVALALSLTAVGCEDLIAEQELNGTWIRDSDGFECKYNKGDWEGKTKDGTPCDKGTYSINDGELTMKTTHYHGSFWPSYLDQRWYTKAELQSYEFFANFRWEYTYTYSISGKTFTRTQVDGDNTDTWTRK